MAIGAHGVEGQASGGTARALVTTRYKLLGGITIRGRLGGAPVSGLGEFAVTARAASVCRQTTKHAMRTDRTEVKKLSGDLRIPLRLGQRAGAEWEWGFRFGRQRPRLLVRLGRRERRTALVAHGVGRQAQDGTGGAFGSVGEELQRSIEIAAGFLQRPETEASRSVGHGHQLLHC